MINEFTKAKTINDVMTCPYCGSDDTYIYSTDDIFLHSNGSGKYIFDCYCESCKKDFRKNVTFKYTIVSEVTK